MVRLSTMRTTVGLRFYKGYMDYDKQPINVEEQVALLQSRWLVIEDIATAKLQLRNISYFRIASYLRYVEEDRLLHRSNIAYPTTYCYNVLVTLIGLKFIYYAEYSPLATL